MCKTYLLWQAALAEQSITRAPTYGRREHTRFKHTVGPTALATQEQHKHRPRSGCITSSGNAQGDLSVKSQPTSGVAPLTHSSCGNEIFRAPKTGSGSARNPFCTEYVEFLQHTWHKLRQHSQT